MLSNILKNTGFFKFILKEKSVVLSYVFYLFTNSLSIILPLVVTPILIRNYNLENYGIMMLHQAIALFLSFLLDNGFRLYYIRLITINVENHDKVTDIFFTFIKIKLFLSFFLTLLYITYINFFVSQQFIFIAYSSILILIGNLLSPSFFLIGIDKFNLVSIINLFSRLFYLALFFCVVYFDKHNNYLNNLYLGLSYLFGSIVSYIIILKFYNINIFFFKKSNFNYLSIKESIPLVVNNIFQNIDVYIHTFIIGFLVSNSNLGIFIAIEKFYSIFKQAIIALIEIYYPKICGQIKLNISDAIDRLKRLIKFLNIFFIIVFISVFILKTYLSQFITNNSGILAQNLIILFMIVPFAIINFNFKSHLLIMALGYDNKIANISFYSVILKSFLLCILFYFFNLYGIIIGLIIIEIFVGKMKSHIINLSNKNSN
jgi:O-antigen/teichoic acid export membrane protein